MAEIKVSAHEIAKDFWRISHELGRPPRRAEYEAKGKFSLEKIDLVFGSWLELTRAIKRAKEDEPEEEEPREPKILVVDLECLPMVLYGYGIYDQNFSVKQIKEDATLASYSAQWLGSDEVIYQEVNWKRDPRDDRKLAKDLFKIMSEADVVVGQNSISFDAKVANERFMRYEIGVMPPVKHLDTKRTAKKHFRLPSYSLEYMADRYSDEKKEKSKKFHGIELQIECLNKNPEAWAEMRLYNMQDVRATTKIFLRFRGWGTGGNLNLYRGKASFDCEECGSSKLHSRGHAMRTTGKFRRYQCQDCGHWQVEKGSGNNLFSLKKRLSLRGK